MKSGFAVTKGDNVIHEGSDYLGKFASVFQAEVFAIIRASKWLLENDKYTGQSVTIYSDSKAALAALNRHEFNSSLVLAKNTT